jgi:hypothetical protein
MLRTLSSCDSWQSATRAAGWTGRPCCMTEPASRQTTGRSRWPRSPPSSGSPHPSWRRLSSARGSGPDGASSRRAQHPAAASGPRVGFRAGMNATCNTTTRRAARSISSVTYAIGRGQAESRTRHHPGHAREGWARKNSGCCGISGDIQERCQSGLAMALDEWFGARKSRSGRCRRACPRPNHVAQLLAQPTGPAGSRCPRVPLKAHQRPAWVMPERCLRTPRTTTGRDRLRLHPERTP